MDLNNLYYVKPHPLVISQDLSDLPSVLEKAFWGFYKPILEEDPYSCCGELNYHLLIRPPLVGCYAIEIEWNEIDYRIVYKINKSVKRVTIFSFDEHKPAYHKAEERVRTTTGYKI